MNLKNLMIIHNPVIGMSASLRLLRKSRKLMMKIIRFRMILKEDRIDLSRENKIIAGKLTSFKKISKSEW